MYRNPQTSMPCSIPALEDLEPRTLMSVNLWANCNFGQDNFKDYLAPYDSGTIRVTIHNDGTTKASGMTRANIYLSTDQTLDEGEDILLASDVKLNVKLAGGKYKTYSPRVTIPSDLVMDDYYLLVGLDTTDVIDETDENDNIAVSDDTQEVQYIFGTFHGRHVTLTLDDTSSGESVPVTFSIKGCGYGLVEADSTEDNPGYNLTIKKTNSSSSLRVSAGDDGTTSISGLDVQGNIKTVDAANADLVGDANIDGVVSRITMADVGDPHGGDLALTIGSAHHWWVDLQFNSVSNLSIDSHERIGDISATEWLDDDHDDLIQAPQIDTMTISGDEDAGIAGDLETSVLAYRDNVYKDPWIGNVNVAGTVREATIRSGRDIDNITVGAAVSSNFLAGLQDDVTQPSDLDDYIIREGHWYWGSWRHDEAISRIKRFEITGLAGADDADPLFVDSNVAAGCIERAYLKNVQYDNGGNEFGLYAAEDNDCGDAYDFVSVYDKSTGDLDTFNYHELPYFQGDFVIQIV